MLDASRYEDVDMAAAVQQIEGLRDARERWPSLWACDGYEYPPRLNREQASSEAAAAYKASLAEGSSVADLTGGMGVDTVAFARRGMRVDYVEREAELCSLMQHNVCALQLDGIRVHHADGMEWIDTVGQQYDTIYVDPARRSAHGRKVAAFEDCQPDLLKYKDRLMRHCGRMLVKASPMIDIAQAERQLGEVAEVHVVSLRGECKEVLFVCRPEVDDTTVCCRSLDGRGEFLFTAREAADARACYCTDLAAYLFEPDAALMKSGAFNLVGQRYGMKKLSCNTHLYTSDTLCPAFFGRTFRVLSRVRRSDIKAVLPEGKAHVVVRNYPAEASVLQRQLGLREGGELFVVATTVGQHRQLLLCERIV